MKIALIVLGVIVVFGLGFVIGKRHAIIQFWRNRW